MRPDVNLWARWLEHLDQVVLTRRQEVTGEEHGGLIVGGIVEVEDLRVRGLMECLAGLEDLLGTARDLQPDRAGQDASDHRAGVTMASGGLTRPQLNPHHLDVVKPGRGAEVDQQ